MTAFRRIATRVLVSGLALSLLAACARNDLSEPPVPLGNFALGLNIVVADKAEKVPISRDATPAEWKASMIKAIDDRFGRYNGNKLYNLGISVDAYALAPPGIPLIAAPKSVLVITANIWDDGARLKLNPEGEQFTIFEGMNGETLIGSGLTRSREKQMEALSYNAAKRVETWLLDNPQWFGLPPKAAPRGADAPSVYSAPEQVSTAPLEAAPDLRPTSAEGAAVAGGVTGSVTGGVTGTVIGGEGALESPLAAAAADLGTRPSIRPVGRPSAGPISGPAPAATAG